MSDLPFAFFDELQIEESPVQEQPVEVVEPNPLPEPVPQAEPELEEPEIIDEPEDVETVEIPTIDEPKPEPDPSHVYQFHYEGDEADLTIKEKLQLKLAQHAICDVTVETLGYHRDSEYVDTQYDVISTKTGFVQLIVHVMRKEIRFQLPRHIQQPTPSKRSKKKTTVSQTPLERVARELQKELGYAWSDWF